MNARRPDAVRPLLALFALFSGIALLLNIVARVSLRGALAATLSLMAVGLSVVLWRATTPDRASSGARSSSIVGVSQVSLFFNMVITIAVGFIIIEVFLAADDVVAAPASDRRAAATAMGIVALLLVALPGTAFADNTNGHADIDDVAAAKAAAASAAGAAAFMKGLPKRKLPEYSGPQGQDQQPKPPKLRDFDPPKPPPPWWMPDGLSDILP